MKPPDRDHHFFIRGMLLASALFLGGNALWLSSVAHSTAGVHAFAALSVGLIVWTIVFTSLPKLVNVIIIAVQVALLASAGFLAWHGNSSDVDYREDAVIVLGAAVHGDTISDTFRARLDAAFAYHEQNPSALIVVTGGQGPQENMAEVRAAEIYLQGKGIFGSRILREEKSTSTEENFVFAKLLLDKQLGSNYRVAFITDDFHVFRAERTARGAGLSATHMSCQSPWYFWPVNYVTETLLALWSLMPG